MKNGSELTTHILELLEKATEAQRKAAYMFILKMVKPDDGKKK